MKKGYMILLIVLLSVCAKSNGVNSQKHYEDKRFQQDSSKPQTIVILLHLYNLGLMDEFINRINRFILLNKSFNFHVKVNVPVASNIESFHKFDSTLEALSEEKESIYKYCVASAPYHPEKVTDDNCMKLYTVSCYFKEKLNVESDKIQVIFSENRGADIGGFFLLIDQLIKEDLPHDYIIKVHTKKDTNWRNKLLAILDLDLKNYIPQYDYISACKWLSTKKCLGECASRLEMQKILKKFGLLELEEFYFSAGTMFIITKAITEFFSKYNRISVFNQLNYGYSKNNGQLEHGYERFFGYLVEALGFKVYYCNTLNQYDLYVAYGRN